MSRTLRLVCDEYSLEAGIGLVIPPASETSPDMGGCIKEDEDGIIEQSVRAVARAGRSDFFSIVDIWVTSKATATHDAEEFYSIAITHHRPGRDAKLVGYIGEGQESIIVGRAYQTDSGLSDKTSGEHMSFTYSEGGSVTALDHDSKNGTVVYRNIIPEQTTHRFEKVSPTGDRDFWKLDNADVRQTFNQYSRQQKRQF